MSRYTRGDVCNVCQTADEEAALEKSFAAAAAKYPGGREPKPKTEGVMHVARGIQLIPEALPGRQSGGHAGENYRQAVEEFLKSGVDCARAEIQGVKRASSAASGFREVLRGDKRCYAAVRQGHCYLVRVKK